MKTCMMLVAALAAASLAGAEPSVRIDGRPRWTVLRAAPARTADGELVRRDFVGWGGLGPLVMLVEVILPDGSRRERDLKAGSVKLEMESRVCGKVSN